MRTKPLLTMVSVITLTIAGAIVFTASCSKEGPVGPAGVDANAVSAADKVAYDAADGFVGGRLYDHLISEAGITNSELKNYPDFFRCKQCHGWDLRGSKGAYINRVPNDTRPPVADNDLYVYASTYNIAEIFASVKHSGGRKKISSAASSYTGSMPDYGLILTDAQIWQLVKFLKKEVHNAFDFYDMNTTGIYPTGTKTFSNIGKGGDPVAGKATYNAQCSSCHGANGKTILIYCGDEYLGDLFRNGPHEVQHKAKFGMPMDIDHPTCQYAGSMPVFSSITEQDIRNILVMGQDTVAFPGYGAARFLLANVQTD